MADTKSLRLIGCALGAVAAVVAVIAALLVADATRIAAGLPTTIAAVD
jgi:hypothetical protein